MKQLQEYASIVWEPEDLVEIRPLQPWQGQRVWTKAGDLGDHVQRMQAENERGADLFAGVLPRTKDGGGTADDVAGGHVIWADFDHCEPEEAAELTGKLGVPMPSMVVATGHGAHLFWRLESFTPKEEIYKIVCGLISFLLDKKETQNYIDKSAKDPARILRLPGFVNHKPPAARARILCSDSSLRYKPSDFDAYTAKREPKKVPVAAKQPIAYAPIGEAERRAKAYLDKMDGSSEGGRTNTAFRAACVMVNDIGLSEAQALPLLEAWDATANVPPIVGSYPDGELQKIICNAKRYAKKPGGCLNTPKATAPTPDLGGVDLSGILSKQTLDKLEPFPSKYLDVPGFIGEVTEYNSATAPKEQPVLALAAAIALQGILCARKLTDEAGTRSNLYICGVAASGAGKDHARQINKRILLEAGISHLQAEGIKSGSGLVNALVTQPALLFQIDEYGRFIKTANNHGKNPHIYEIISKLLGLYSSSGDVYESDRYADRDAGGKQIHTPHAILYGTTVPRSLYEGLSEESVTDGFLSRTLIFDVDGNNPLRRRVKTSPVPQSIIDRAKWWGDYNPGGGNLNPEAHVAPITAKADAIATEFIEIEHREQETMKDSPLATLWTRTAQNADKLALIYAASRDAESPVIDAEAARWGYGLAEWLTRRMVTIIGDNVADNPFHGVCLKIKRILQRSGGEMGRSKLLRKLKIRSRELDEAVNYMLENGTVQIYTTESNETHRASISYKIVGGNF